MTIDFLISALVTLFVVVDVIGLVPTFIGITEGLSESMVFGVRMRRQGEAAEQALEERTRNIAAFPLAIPLMAGPGAITATVLRAARAEHDVPLLGLLIAVVILVAAS